MPQARSQELNIARGGETLPLMIYDGYLCIKDIFTGGNSELSKGVVVKCEQGITKKC